MKFAFLLLNIVLSIALGQLLKNQVPSVVYIGVVVAYNIGYIVGCIQSVFDR